MISDILHSVSNSDQQKKDRAILVREKEMRKNMVTVHKARSTDDVRPRRCWMVRESLR